MVASIKEGKGREGKRTCGSESAVLMLDQVAFE